MEALGLAGSKVAAGGALAGKALAPSLAIGGATPALALGGATPALSIAGAPKAGLFDGLKGALTGDTAKTIGKVGLASAMSGGGRPPDPAAPGSFNPNLRSAAPVASDQIAAILQSILGGGL